jgi:hypothetical protein
MSESLWLGVFDQDSMAASRMQKTDPSGQSLPGLLVDHRYATCLGSLEFTVHIVGLKTYMMEPLAAVF